MSTIFVATLPRPGSSSSRPATRASQSGSSSTSVLTRATTSQPAATAIPRFAATAKPVFAPSATTCTPSASSCSHATDPSVDPLSTTTIASAGRICARSDASSPGSQRRPFQFGTTTATRTAGT
jgi:hypothetical protein